MARHVKTVYQLIDELDGPAVVAGLCGVGVTAVYHWPERGIPPEHYLVLTRALERKGCTWPDTLFNMREAAE